MKIVLVVFFILFALYELWFLNGVHSEKSQGTLKITIPKLPPLQDANRSVSSFFDPQHWLLTEADRRIVKQTETNTTKKEKLYDKNTTVELVMKKGTRQLCRGKKCIVIRGIIANTLLLEEDNGSVVAMKPLDTVFDNIELLKVNDTQLFFINKETQEKYNLEFFAYRQIREETNETNSTNKANTKDKR